ncbi:MAG TPA: excinuclease ABC subunit UvrC [Bacteroidales bacterium]|nr:excinuclease ABC subunit UvrC [Bacteroidales bacterium]HRW97525.1 excinuclease ABC subunit UvrC [Bacteroidales bacterium]
MGSSEKVKKTDQHTVKLKNIVRTLPEKPGVYQFLDARGKIIYVGKAKSLRKRVASYFNKETGISGKTSVMVKKIDDILHIVVDSEPDALLLENNLIKKYQPRYNVNLKDDKSYPWICVKNEPFPRVFPTRTVIHDGSVYFGPYASVRMMNTLLDLIRQLYKLRTCNLNLSEKNIAAHKFKVCLEYHLGNCKGPCEGLQQSDDYAIAIAEIKEILKGNISNVLVSLRELMKRYASELAFENAQMVKEKIELLEKYQSKSLVVNPKIHNVDVFSIVSDDESGYVNYLRVINGAIVQAHTIELKKKLDESDNELIAIAVTDLRQRFDSDAPEIIVPVEVDFNLPGTTITLPKIGDKKHLLELSERNARYYMIEKRKQLELIDPERHTKRILNTMMKDLKLPDLPVHIECFDNSNMQGHYPVAAMVCFRNARPSKNDYRHFNIKTVEGPNDFASMEEVIFRRYQRLLEEEQNLPQLIIVDGGKGQLSSAVKSLEKLNLRGKISIIGIAKRLEELYFPDDPVPLHIDKKSETLKVIQYMRDEAHRFGITHYRKKHEKGTIKTTLTEIEGIGNVIARKLLSRFKSVKRIKEASVDELESVIGKVKGQVVYNYFKKIPDR